MTWRPLLCCPCASLFRVRHPPVPTSSSCPTSDSPGAASSTTPTPATPPPTASGSSGSATAFSASGVDLARTPDFLADAQGRVRDSTLTTVMANVIVGGPLPEERGFRPYLSGGVGVLNYDVTRTSGLQASEDRLRLQHRRRRQRPVQPECRGRDGLPLHPEHQGLHARRAGLRGEHPGVRPVVRRARSAVLICTSVQQNL